MSKEINSCPFCGGRPRLIDDGDTAYIQCSKCYASGPCFHNESEHKGVYKQLAVEAWHLRTHKIGKHQIDIDNSGIKMQGLQEKEYWKLVRKRLKKEGIRI